DQVAERRLREVQMPRRRGEAAPLRDLHESAELPQRDIHEAASWIKQKTSLRRTGPTAQCKAVMVRERLPGEENMKIAKFLLFATLSAFGVSVAAQSFPSKPVRIVVPYPPGGGVDTLARPLADRLGKLWGATVIVENKPGAGTIIGADAVARAEPD